MSNQKICPIMSRLPSSVDASYDKCEIMCVEHRCMLWIEVFTTEQIRINGCSLALQPSMQDGLFRV